VNYRKSYKLFRIGLWVGLPLMVASVIFEGLLPVAVTLLVSGICILLAATIQAGVFCRCPHCKNQIDFRRGIPNYCPHCGKVID